MKAKGVTHFLKDGVKETQKVWRAPLCPPLYQHQDSSAHTSRSQGRKTTNTFKLPFLNPLVPGSSLHRAAKKEEVIQWLGEIAFICALTLSGGRGWTSLWDLVLGWQEIALSGSGSNSIPQIHLETFHHLLPTTTLRAAETTLGGSTAVWPNKTTSAKQVHVLTLFSSVSWCFCNRNMTGERTSVLLFEGLRGQGASNYRTTGP